MGEHDAEPEAGANGTKRALPSTFPHAMRGSVWLLEDSALQAAQVAEALRPLADVRVFHDSPQLLEALAEAQPDTLVLDLNVPHISGLEVLQIVRSSHDEVTLPVLILTADQGSSTLLQALEIGANDHATKPFEGAELRARVSALVRVRQLHARAKNAERELAQALAREGVARAQAESDRSRLAANELQLRLITDALPVLVSLVSPDERYAMVNRGYEHWFGVAAEQLVGRTVREVIGEPAYAVLGPYVKRGLAGERFSFEQYDVPYRLGGTRDVRVSFVPLRSAGDRSGGYVALLEDITSQRKMEAERERLAEQRAETLRTQAQFEQQLIGIVSHDLRTPLNVITLSSARLARDEELSASAAKSVVRVQNAVERASRMVADLLDFTQARLGGGIRIERRRVDLHELIDVLVAELDAAYPERQIECTHEGDGHGDWDPERVKQVAQNLIGNALKYSPSHSVVRVTTRGEAGAGALTVHNEGPAIAEDKLSSLFEPMQRGIAQVDKVSRSVGLGLYIVKQIVEAHAGTVSVQSTDADGTTFRVLLPAVGMVG